MAPTGKAAYLLKGNKIHSALKVPINQSMVFHSLDADQLNNPRTQLAQVQFAIIDAISKVGLGRLSFINARQKEVSMSSTPLGGKSVLACVDIFQLLHVFDSSVFQPVKTGYGPLASNLLRRHIKDINCDRRISKSHVLFCAKKQIQSYRWD